jgi:hypothetical protein
VRLLIQVTRTIFCWTKLITDSSNVRANLHVTNYHFGRDVKRADRSVAHWRQREVLYRVSIFPPTTWVHLIASPLLLSHQEGESNWRSPTSIWHLAITFLWAIYQITLAKFYIWKIL